MEKYIHTLIWFLIIIGVGYLGYFSFTRLSDEVEYTDPAVVVSDDVEEDDENDSETDVVDLGDTDSSEEDDSEEDDSEDEDDEEETTPSAGELSAASKDLVGRLGRLISVYGKVMKEGASGTRVGTVQEFLNVYEGKAQKSGLDNQYGSGTRTSVRAFQKEVGLDADGLAGPGTFQAMIDWIKKNQ